MAIVDWIILALAVFAGVKGFMRGFLVETLSFFAFFIGLFIALKLTFPISLKFFGDTEAFWIISLVIFLVLLFGIMWLSKMIAEGMKKAIEASPLGVVDRIFGVAVAILKWMFVFSVLIWVLSSLDIVLPAEWTNDSYLFRPVISFAPFVFEQLSGLLPFFEDILESMKATPRRV